MAAHRWWEALVSGSFGWTFFQWKMLHWSYLRWLLGPKNLVKISWWTSATCSSRSSTERTNYFDQVNVWNWQKQWQIHTSDTTSFETTQDKPALWFVQNRFGQTKKVHSLRIKRCMSALVLRNSDGRCFWFSEAWKHRTEGGRENRKQIDTIDAVEWQLDAFYLMLWINTVKNEDSQRVFLQRAEETLCQNCLNLSKLQSLKFSVSSFWNICKIQLGSLQCRTFCSDLQVTVKRIRKSSISSWNSPRGMSFLYQIWSRAQEGEFSPQFESLIIIGELWKSWTLSQAKSG